MNMLKKFTALLLGAALLLSAAACNTGATHNENGDNGSGATEPSQTAALGRYVEENWTMPAGSEESTGTVHLLPDGRIGLVLYVWDDYSTYYYTTTDGTTWTEDPPEWFLALQEQGEHIQSVSFNSKGQAAIVHYGTTNTVSILEPDGTLTPTLIGTLDDDTDDVNYVIVPPAAMERAEEELDGDAPPEAEVAVKADAVTAEGEGDAADDGEGEEEEFDYNDFFYVDSALMGEDGYVYLKDFSDLFRYDPVTGRKLAMLSEYGSTYTQAGDTLVQAMYSRGVSSDTHPITQNSLIFFDEHGDDKITGVEMLSSHGSESLLGQPDGSLYLACPAGIYRLGSGAQTWERIMDGGFGSMSLPSMSINQILAHGEDEFLIAYTENTNTKLMNYRYDPDTPTLPDTELTVYTLRENRTLMQAVGVFRQRNPRVIVNIETLLEDDSSATVDDAVRALNTELLAGKGPDLLILDGMPMESYLEKGVLADLSPLRQELVEEGAILGNLAGAFEADGKTYALPARFYAPGLWGDEAAIAASPDLASLVEYAEQNPHKRMFFNHEPEALIQKFALMSQPAWLEGGSLDTAALAQYLTLIDRLAKTGGSASLWTPSEEINYSFGFHTDQDVVDDMMALKDKDAELMGLRMGGFNAMLEPNGAVNNRAGNSVFDSFEGIKSVSNVKEVYRPFNGQVQGTYLPTSIVGVNASGHQQELAADFVRAMLDHSTQLTDLGDGFPVNPASIEYGVVREDGLYLSYITDDMDNTEKSIEMGYPTEEMRRAVCDTFGSLDTPVILNETLLEMIIDESKPFFGGSATADQVAQRVADKARLMLAE